jgi:flagellar biosynthetic protein FliO
MMRPAFDAPASDRIRQVYEHARQKPLATALVLTIMLAALFGAYALATGSEGGDEARDPGTTSAGQSVGEESGGGFLADGYAELEGEESSGGGVNWWGDVPGLLIRLAIVLGLAYGSLRLLNYFTRSGRLGGQTGRALEVVDQLNLGQNRSIYLVRVAGRVLVVGATGNQLNLLSRMASDDLPEDVRTSAPNFTSQLQARIRRQLGNGAESEEEIEQRRKVVRELRDEEPVSPPA